MRVPVLAAAALLVVPSVAHAADVRSQTRELDVQGRALVTQRFAGGFDLVGVNALGPGSVAFRVRTASGRWSAWHGARPEAEDVPDAPQRWKVGNPWWSGRAGVVQARVRGHVTRLRMTVVRSVAEAVPLRRLAAAGTPAIIPRRAWAGSDTGYRRAVPARYADAVRFAVVHHTAGASPATPAQSVAMVRAIAVYHVRANGWDDIGYNFVVDRFGQIFEGRYGGIDRPVIGAHAQGFNSGSAGVALLGTYSSAAPSAAAQDALVRLLAWRLDLAHVDPLAKVTYSSGGNPEFRPGAAVPLRVISGHRDTGYTSCPGARAYALLPHIAARVAATGLPKLYTPRAQSLAGGLVRFTARISGAVPWRITVADADGITVGEGSGTGPAVDWSWDSTQVSPGRYHWTITSGTARPASGSFSGGSAVLAISASASPVVVSPDGDGHADAGSIRYRLGTASVVTASLLDPLGTVLATFPQGMQTAGAHTLTWPADAYADGAYNVLLAAVAGGRELTTTVVVGVNRTLSGLAVAAPAFSPALGALSYSFALTASADVTVTVARAGATPVVLSTGSLPAGSQTLQWIGTDSAGVPVADGSYTLGVQAVNTVGTVTQTVPMVVDSRAPQLRLVSRRPVKIRSTEASTLTIVADGRTLTARAGAGIRRISVVGRRVTVFATDAAGNRSATLRLR
ncbi:MAG: FlgD immunoglobulin-like domain containing protein [Gaiellaceae bacterium]